MTIPSSRDVKFVELNIDSTTKSVDRELFYCSVNIVMFLFDGYRSVQLNIGLHLGKYAADILQVVASLHPKTDLETNLSARECNLNYAYHCSLKVATKVHKSI